MKLQRMCGPLLVLQIARRHLWLITCVLQPHLCQSLNNPSNLGKLTHSVEQFHQKSASISSTARSKGVQESFLAQSCNCKDMLFSCTVKLLLLCSLLIRTLLASARVCLLASCPCRAWFSAFRRSRVIVMVPFSACTGAFAGDYSLS